MIEQSEIFFKEIQEAFQFLVQDYGYQFLESFVKNAKDWRDATATSRYVGTTIGVEVIWYFAGSYIGVAFVELQQTFIFPEMYSFYPMDRLDVPKAINLYELAEVLNKRNDAEFLLKDVKNTRQINKQRKFIEGHLHDIIMGLARATQNCASTILKGETSTFDNVMRYWLVKYRKLYPDTFLPGLKQQDEQSQQ